MGNNNIIIIITISLLFFYCLTKLIEIENYTEIVHTKIHHTNKVINHVCALGPRCISSFFLKRTGLKNESYPFDWIYSSVDVIKDCISNDFKVFLDKKYYKEIDETKCGHLIYGDEEFDNLGFWAHHNLLRNEHEYQYYIRCISRFKKLLKSPKHKLFILIFINDKFNDIINNKVIDFNKFLANYTSNYTLLVVIHHPNKDKNNYTFVTENNIDYINLDTHAVSAGKDFLNEEDNLYFDNILKNLYSYELDKVNT